MPADYKGRLYLLLTGCCPPKLQTSLINSIFIGCGRATRWVGERDNSPKGILENTGQRRWLGVSGGNPIHGLSSCVKVHRQKAQLGTTFPLLLLLLAIIQKRTQYLYYRLLKKKWKWRIVLGTKTFTFFKNVWLDNRFFKLRLIVSSSFTQIFERTIVCQNVLGTALADQ